MLMLAIGSALREVCGDQGALGLHFVEEARTAPRYRLFALRPLRGARKIADDGISVPGELVEIDDERWPELLATEPEGINPVRSARGRPHRDGSLDCRSFSRSS